MSLDTTEMNLTRSGEVHITIGGEVILTGFEGYKCTCRDTAVLALSWAIRILHEELDALLRKPGGTGKTGIG